MPNPGSKSKTGGKKYTEADVEGLISRIAPTMDDPVQVRNLRRLVDEKYKSKVRKNWNVKLPIC